MGNKRYLRTSLPLKHKASHDLIRPSLQLAARPSGENPESRRLGLSSIIDSYIVNYYTSASTRT